VAALTDARQGFRALPGVAQEVNQIQALFPKNTKVLLNPAFTEQAFSQQVIQEKPTILHLATHAQFSQELDNTFLLTWDGRIRIGDFARLLQPNGSSPVDLLVMSACQTAQGDDRTNLGLAGFALRSGARSTIATLWSVNDQSTARLMSALYQSLSNTVPKAEALREAQLSLLNNPATRHPYFWAGFVLVGNWL
jgi:CHAT domain-containing protein